MTVVPAIQRVLVLGTGAMGALLGARLARGGLVEVTLAGTWSAALDAIGRHGVVVVEDDEDEGRVWSARPGVAPLDGPLPRADLVLVLVKSHRTAAVAPHAARALAPGGVALSLQNGLGNREALAAACGGERVLQGVTAIGSTVIAAGRVRAFGAGGTVVGAAPAPAAAQAVVLLLRRCGLPATVVADLTGALWRKLAVNSAINPVSALTGVTNGELLARADARAVMAAAALEVEAVARALGVDGASGWVDAVFSVAHATAGNRSSMLQDVLRGVPTEIDAINGAVTREARRLGLPAPVNEWLWNAVRSLPADGAPRASVAGAQRVPLPGLAGCPLPLGSVGALAGAAP